MQTTTTRRVFLLGVGAAICGCRRHDAYDCGPPLPLDGHFLTEYTRALGAEVRLTLRADCEGAMPVDEAFLRAFDQFDELERLFNVHDPASQLSQLNQKGELLDADPRLIALLDLAEDIYQRSGGVFDPSVQPLWQLYADTQANGLAAPPQPQLDDALHLVGFDHWSWDREERWVRCESRAGDGSVGRPALTLNGIVHGYVLDETIRLMHSLGIADALLDTGVRGTLGVGETGPWQLGVQQPTVAEKEAAMIVADGRCLATSGRTAATVDNKGAAQHLLHPVTGVRPTSVASVSVLAATGAAADGLSTAVFVLGPDAGLKLVQATPEADAVVITSDGRTVFTDGFPALA